jgi:hypothetical protein
MPKKQTKSKMQVYDMAACNAFQDAISHLVYVYTVVGNMSWQDVATILTHAADTARDTAKLP